MNVFSYLWFEAVCHQNSEDWISLSYLKQKQAEIGSFSF